MNFLLSLFFFSFINTFFNLFKHISRTSSLTFGFIFQFLIIEKSDCVLNFSNIFSINLEKPSLKTFFKSNFLKLLFKKSYLNFSFALLKSIISLILSNKSEVIFISVFPDSSKKLIKSLFFNELVFLIIWIPVV